MRLLSVGGEAVHPADVEAFRSVFPPSCVLQNAMATTETRTYSQCSPSSGPISTVPIGWPVAGKEVVLLDENGEPASDGCEEGEIAVRGPYLALGYANDSLQTAVRFRQQEDGSVLYRTGDRGQFASDDRIVFLGRTDAQAKIRGHRVELDHIAHVLELHPEVRTSVATAQRDSAGNDQLVAYVVAHADCDLTQNLLRDFFRERLPAYAVPSVFIFLAELPLNANFKVSRGGFRRRQRFHDNAARSEETIEVVRGIWKAFCSAPKSPMTTALLTWVVTL